MQERSVAFDTDGAPESKADIFSALYRDEDKLHTYRGTQASKSGIDIYSCAGKLLRRINVSDEYSRRRALNVAVTDLYSGIKVQYVGWDGPRMRSYSSLQKMALSDAIMTCKEISPNSPLATYVFREQALTSKSDQRSTRALRNMESRPAVSGPLASLRSFRTIA